MDVQEYSELHALIERVAAQDGALGNVLFGILNHVARLASLDLNAQPAEAQPGEGEAHAN